MTNSTQPKLCYIEIPAPKLEESRRFYEELFGWKFGDGIPGTRYFTFNDGGGLSGGLNPALPVHPDQGFNIVFKVSDIARTLEVALASGGSIVRPKYDVGGGHGFSAVIRDVCGNPISLWAET